jgi:putative transposase
MCHVHLVRAVLKNIPNKHKQEIAQKVKEALENEQTIQTLSDELANRGYSKALDTVERFRLVLWNYRAFSKSH